MKRHVLWPRLGLTGVDLLVVAAASLVFAATVASTQRVGPRPPAEQKAAAVAGELGIGADRLRHAVEQVPPPPRGAGPAAMQLDEHRRELADALGVPPEHKDPVMRRHGEPHSFN